MKNKTSFFKLAFSAVCAGLLLALTIVVPVYEAQAQSPTILMGQLGTCWAGTGTGQGDTNYYYVVSVNTAMAPFYNGQAAIAPTPVVRYINITNDVLSANSLQFFSVSNKVTVWSTNFAAANIAGTNNNLANASAVFPYNVSSNGYTAGQGILIRHVATDTYEPSFVAVVNSSNYVTSSVLSGNQGLANTTNFTTNVLVEIGLPWAPLYPIATNDQIWVTTTNGGLSAAAATTAFGTDSGGMVYCGQPGQPLLIELTTTSAHKGRINVIAGEWR